MMLKKIVHKNIWIYIQWNSTLLDLNKNSNDVDQKVRTSSYIITAVKSLTLKRLKFLKQYIHIIETRFSNLEWKKLIMEPVNLFVR